MRAPELWQVALCLSQQRMSITIPRSSQPPTSPRWGVPATPKALGCFFTTHAVQQQWAMLSDTFDYFCSITWKSSLFQALGLFEFSWAPYAAVWEQEHIPAWTSKLPVLDWRDWEVVWGNWEGGSCVSWAGLAARPQHLCPPSPQPHRFLGFWDIVCVRHNHFSSCSSHPQQTHHKMINSDPLDGFFFFFSFHQEITKLQRSDSWDVISVKSSMLRAPLLLLDMFVCTTGAPRDALVPPCCRLYEHTSMKSQKLEHSGSELTNIQVPLFSPTPTFHMNHHNRVSAHLRNLKTHLNKC